MGRGPPGDPVCLWCNFPSCAPQCFAPNEDVARHNFYFFSGDLGQGGTEGCEAMLISAEMWHLESVYDIASVIGIFLLKRERGNYLEAYRNLKMLTW